MTKLKPCPFCGSENLIIRNNYVPCVQCLQCKALVSFFDMPPGRRDDTGLINKFNRRIQEAENGK